MAARHLSFTRAAEELFVTPSAVSHQIKALEESLGVQLFIRDAKALVLTPAGTAYLPSVQLAFKQLADATHRLHSKDRPALKVNMPPTFAVKWLIPRMATASISSAMISTWRSATAAATIPACIASCAWRWK